eukprot:INCI3983.1.p1 GENE.INCI3983.1~~INCI3983.1.p1  ORF type:complete len:275 (+),score=45.70 INCI3983.1:118-942(+)
MAETSDSRVRANDSRSSTDSENESTLKQEATAAWETFLANPTRINFPDMRRFASCTRVNVEFVDKLKGCNEGSLHVAMVVIQRYFVKRKSFPIGTDKVGPKRARLRQFFEDAGRIIAREDALRAGRSRRARKTSAVSSEQPSRVSNPGSSERSAEKVDKKRTRGLRSSTEGDSNRQRAKSIRRQSKQLSEQEVFVKDKAALENDLLQAQIRESKERGSALKSNRLLEQTKQRLDIIADMMRQRVQLGLSPDPRLKDQYEELSEKLLTMCCETSK